MRRLLLLLAVAILPAAGWAQQNATNVPTVPQTARQALMEMFFSKTPGTLVKHLPAATRAALDKSGALASMQQYSMMLTQLQAQGQNVQTFETGSVLVSTDDPKTGEKAEVTVENDALRGDTDDIEVTFHMYKNGQEQPTPFRSMFTFTMKQEAQLWTLNEISFTIRVPLADPGFLKIISEKMKPQAVTSGSSAPITVRPEVSGQPAGSDAMVVAAMRTIVAAEITYASSYPAVGFTCSLSSLDGFGGGEPNEHQAMLINSGLASGKKYGYVFSLSDCSGMPAARFHLTAATTGNNYGRKAFCADQSGVIRSSSDGSAANCLASGAPVQ